MASQYPVRRFLDLSTAHLHPDTRELLDHNTGPSTVYPHPNGYGWFIYVPDDPATPFGSFKPLPDLQAAVDLARTLDCAYLLFDRDGPLIHGLPVFNV